MVRTGQAWCLNWCHCFRFFLELMPGGPGCHLTLLMTLFNYSSVLLENRRSCSRKLLWRKNTLSVEALSAPIETVVSVFMQPWPFFGLFACFCIASFMRTMKTLQIKLKFHVIQCVCRLEAKSLGEPN